MAMFGKAQGRLEDQRFLTGKGRYVEDIVPEGALWVAFLRSPVAHAEIRSLDVAAAEAAPGVQLVLTAERLAGAGVVLGMRGYRVTQLDGSKGAGPERPVLALGRVRHVGEALAMVVAETPDQARDAVEMIEADLRDLPVALFPEGGPTIHPEAPGITPSPMSRAMAGRWRRRWLPPRIASGLPPATTALPRRRWSRAVPGRNGMAPGCIWR